MAHYDPTEATDVRITRNELYLIDSGGQYSDGTTDITRTVHFGQPSDAERDSFTRVLKGFISLVRTVFPTDANVSKINGFLNSLKVPFYFIYSSYTDKSDVI